MREEIDAKGAGLPLFFVSTAQRARGTFDGLKGGWASLSQQEATYDGALYTFNDADLVNWLAAVDDGLDSIAIIGHNPAMTDLANFLCPSLTLPNLPTAGWLWFSFDDCSWGNSVRSPARGNCRAVYTPKSGKLL